MEGRLSRWNKDCYKARMRYDLSKMKDYFSQKQYNSKAFEGIESIRNEIETMEPLTMKHWF